MSDLTLAAKYWRAPFHYWKEASAVMDANDNKIIDMRGWGYLTGASSHGLGYDVAAMIQDEVGVHVTKLLNESWPKEKGGPKAALESSEGPAS